MVETRAESQSEAVLDERSGSGRPGSTENAADALDRDATTPTRLSLARPGWARHTEQLLGHGDELGRYAVGARLGQGGMGTVFVARDKKLNRRVAVKLLHPRGHDLDFGLARSEDDDAPQMGAQASLEVSDPHAQDDPLPTHRPPAQTRTGRVTGTPRYMAPEQHEGKPLDPRCDQFAFCVVVYELLCGVHPFAEPTSPNKDVYAAARSGTWARPTKPVPGPLVSVLRRGMAPSRQRRFPSMQALRDALEHVKAGT